MATELRMIDINKALNYIKYLDSLDLAEVELIDEDQEPVEFKHAMLEEWKFIGMANRSFFSMRFWEQ